MAILNQPFPPGHKAVTGIAHFGYVPVRDTNMYSVNAGYPARDALMELSTLLASIREILTVEEQTDTNYGVCALVDMCQGICNAVEFGLREVEVRHDNR